jgi:hypothetical protein
MASGVSRFAQDKAESLAPRGLALHGVAFSHLDFLSYEANAPCRDTDNM